MSKAIETLTTEEQATVRAEIGAEQSLVTPLYLTARFTTDNVDVSEYEHGLAILASPSPFTAGYAVKVPCYKPASGGMRDTSLIYWKGKYFVAYTAGSYGAVTYFTVIGSSNLVDWEHVADVPVAMGAKTWGPEFFVDGNVLYVLVGANNSWPADSELYLVEALNDGLTSWGAPAMLTGFTLPVNDACLRKIGSTYHIACTYLGPGNYIEFWTATNRLGPYTRRLAQDHSGWGITIEGACLTELADGRWMLTGDHLSSTGVSYYSISDDDMATWGPLVAMDLPKGLRHGTTIRLDGNEHFRNVLLAAMTAQGNLNHRALESSDFVNGVPAALGFSDPNYWSGFGYKYLVGWFLANAKGARTGSGSYGAASQDAFRTGWNPEDPCTITVGMADHAERAALGGVLQTSATLVDSVGTTPTDMHAFTVPANTLNRNGESIKYEMFGRFNSGVNTTECQFYVNGGLLATTNPSVWYTSPFVFSVTILRLTSTNLLVRTHLQHGSTSNHLHFVMGFTAASAFVVKCVGIGGSATNGEVKGDALKVTWYPANA